MRKSIAMALGFALLSSGCGGGPNRPPTQDEGEAAVLFQVGELCRYYQLSKKKPPETFTNLAAANSMAGNGYEAVKNGSVVLRYGAALPDTKEEPGEAVSDEVLAYQKQVPQSGGKVLMLDRRVKTMTADQFKAAKKAGKD
jgi:hypothetical protein